MVDDKRRVKIDECKNRLSSLPITMAFGYILNAMGRLARWGVLREARPAEDVAHTLTHTVHVESTCHGNPQQYYRINYWPVAAGIMLHRVSREGGRSMLQRGPTYQTHTHTVYMVGAALPTHVRTYHFYVIFFFQFLTSPLHSADNKSDHPYMKQHVTSWFMITELV